MYDIIIVGGGPAGLTAATYACRAGKTVLVIEKAAFGGQITWSPKVENFPTVVSISGTELGDRLLEQAMEPRARRSSWRRSYPSRIAAAASSCAASPARSLRRRLSSSQPARSPECSGLSMRRSWSGTASASARCATAHSTRGATWRSTAAATARFRRYAPERDPAARSILSTAAAASAAKKSS